MRAYVITIKGHEGSERQAQECWESSAKVGNEFDIEIFNATTPADVTDMYADYGLAYNGKDQPDLQYKMSCSMSHYRLWRLAAAADENTMILEHDSLFLRKYEPVDFPTGCLTLYTPNFKSPPTEGEVYEREGSGATTRGYILTPQAAQQLLAEVHADGFLRKNSHYFRVSNAVVDPVILDSPEEVKSRNLKTSRGY